MKLPAKAEEGFHGASCRALRQQSAQGKMPWFGTLSDPWEEWLPNSSGFCYTSVRPLPDFWR